MDLWFTLIGLRHSDSVLHIIHNKPVHTRDPWVFVKCIWYLSGVSTDITVTLECTWAFFRWYGILSTLEKPKCTSSAVETPLEGALRQENAAKSTLPVCFARKGDYRIEKTQPKLLLLFRVVKENILKSIFHRPQVYFEGSVFGVNLEFCSEPA